MSSRYWKKNNVRKYRRDEYATMPQRHLPTHEVSLGVEAHGRRLRAV